ncbi:hypothetical protein G6F56_001048 [Rhizopus delemar]|uniref:Sm domain-containing protein n=1 Tax=Rhizopus stolonifer TaxID=4846 RepID=A0A367KXP8_RHIST|nr:hypothetical protein G6F56_001048 [Rhizopus delemar]RCI06954.1 hypothetical protein CU098_011844 [Rhizopus stolonifer]
MADTPNIQKLASYLNFQARIKITDGRIFVGTFMCIDKQKNVILANTKEYREEEERLVGLVMIPGEHLVKMETEDLEVSPMYA